MSSSGLSRGPIHQRTLSQRSALQARLAQHRSTTPAGPWVLGTSPRMTIVGVASGAPRCLLRVTSSPETATVMAVGPPQLAAGNLTTFRFTQLTVDRVGGYEDGEAVAAQLKRHLFIGITIS